jgi:hypothetical protein
LEGFGSPDAVDIQLDLPGLLIVMETVAELPAHIVAGGDVYVTYFTVSEGA